MVKYLLEKEKLTIEDVFERSFDRAELERRVLASL